LYRSGWPVSLKVLLGHFPRRLDSLRAAGGEENTVQVTGRQFRQPLRQLDGLGVGVGPQREVGELGRLPRAGLGDLLAAVADLAHEQAGQPVQVSPPVLVEDVGTRAADDHGDFGLGVAGHSREVQPQVALGGFLKVRDVVEGGCHLVPHE
jgi:hypothetical protein